MPESLSPAWLVFESPHELVLKQLMTLSIIPGWKSIAEQGSGAKEKDQGSSIHTEIISEQLS